MVHAHGTSGGVRSCDTQWDRERSQWHDDRCRFRTTNDDRSYFERKAQFRALIDQAGCERVVLHIC
jgi:hypothetical protein